MPPRTRSNASDHASESPVPRPSQTRKRRRGRSIAEGQSQKRHCQQDDNFGPAQDTIVVRNADDQGLDLEQIPSQSAKSPGAERVADADSAAGSEAASTTIPARPPITTQSTSNDVVAQASGDDCGQSDDAMTKVSIKVLEKLLSRPPFRRRPLRTICQCVGWSFCVDCILPLLRQRASEDASVWKTCERHPRPWELTSNDSINPLARLAYAMSLLFDLPAERFAFAWACYPLYRWLVGQSAGSFAMIPTYLVPTTRQLIEPHSFFIDSLPWPRMRDNAIRLGPKFNPDKVYSLLASTQRLSRQFRTTNCGPVGEGSCFIIDIIDTRMFNTYVMHDGAWLLHEKFWKEYPELVDGLDANIMFKDGQLLPDFTAATALSDSSR